MSKQAGSLYVTLTAKTTDFSKQMQKAAKDTAELAEKVAGAANRVAGFGAVIVGPVVASLRTATKYSQETKDAVERMGNAFGALAVEVSKAVLPAVKALTEGIAKTARWVHDLDPGTKKLAVTVVEVAAGVSALALAIGQISGGVAAFNNLQAALLKMGTSFGGVLLTVGAVAAALAALVLVAGFVREAWDQNLGGIRDKFAAVWKWITSKVGVIKDAFASALKFVVQIFADAISELAKLWVGFGKMLGQDFSGSAGFLQDISAWAASFASGDNSLGAVWDDFAEAAQPAMAKIGELWDMTVSGMTKNWESFKKGIGFDKAGIMATSLDQQHEVEVGRVSDTMPGSNRKISDYYTEKVRTQGPGGDFKSSGPNVMGAFTGALEGAVGKLGKAGEVMTTAMQGFATGGPWGALIAVIVDLVTGSRQFQASLEPVNEGLEMLGDAFGELFASGKAINEAVNKILGPIFELVGTIFGGISDLLGVLAPVFEALGAVIKPIVKIIQETLGPVFFILGLILKAVAAVILMVIRSIAGIWNLIIEAIAGIIGVFNKDAAWEFRKKKMDTNALDEAMRNLFESTEDNTDAQERQAEAADKATEALSNVPRGYKVALARFNSIVEGLTGAAQRPSASPAAAQSVTDAWEAGHSGEEVDFDSMTPDQQTAYLAGQVIRDQESGGAPNSGKESDEAGEKKFAEGGVVTGPTRALIGEAGPEAVIPLHKLDSVGSVSVTIISDSAERIWRELKPLMRRDGFRLAGG